MENMRHVPTLEQKIALRNLTIEAGKIIDFANNRHEDDDGDVLFDATWDDGDLHYELASLTRVDTTRDTEKFATPYAYTLYYLSVWSTISDREEYYTFGSENSYITTCDEEWDELDVDDDESQLELSERLAGYLESYNRLSLDEQEFKDLVMTYEMSKWGFYHRLKLRRQRDGNDERFTQRLMDKYPVLDEQTIARGIKRYMESKVTAN